MTRRLFLIHWNEEEAKERAERLRAEGWEVEVEAKDGADAAERIKASPPDAVVVSLSRLPSHGRETARYLRSRYAPEDLPIVFVGGDEEKVARVREAVPQAAYTSFEGLPGVLEELTGG